MSTPDSVGTSSKKRKHDHAAVAAVEGAAEGKKKKTKTKVKKGASAVDRGVDSPAELAVPQPHYDNNSVASPSPAPPAPSSRMFQRNHLAETFGNKKAKAAIRAQERAKVDTKGLEDVADYLLDSIETSMSGLPTQEIVQANADAERPIPPPNLQATELSDVYSLPSIIPAAEYKALDVKPLLSAPGDSARAKLLPYASSDYVFKRMSSIVNGGGRDKKKLKMLLYISYLFAFRRQARIVGNTALLTDKLKNPPGAIIAGLTQRFAEKSRGFTKAVVTPFTEAKLLSYMAALCLMVDDFATDVSLLAKDLSMPNAKIMEVFKSLGCKADLLTAAERDRLGMTTTEAAKIKRAVLRLPLTFPKPKKGPAKR